MFRLLISTVLIAPTFFFASCDSGPDISDDDPLNNPDGIATSLTIPEAGDILTLTRVNGIDQGITNLTLGGLVTTDVSGVSYVYEKTGDHTFSIAAEIDPAANLQTSLDTILGSTGVIGVELRSLLLIDDPDDISPEDLQRIVELINPAGGDLFISENDLDELKVINTTLIQFNITSTNDELQRGIMGGLYQTDLTSLIVAFRRPTDSELTDYRFLTEQHWIPEVSTQLEYDENIQQGVFSLEFIN